MALTVVPHAPAWGREDTHDRVWRMSRDRTERSCHQRTWFRPLDFGAARVQVFANEVPRTCFGFLHLASRQGEMYSRFRARLRSALDELRCMAGLLLP